jgi:hypothetical protein
MVSMDYGLDGQPSLQPPREWWFRGWEVCPSLDALHLANSSTSSPVGTIGRALHWSLVTYTFKARVDHSWFSDCMFPLSRTKLKNSYFHHYSHLE